MSATVASKTGDGSWPKAVLFDLDGTLIDSVPDIAAATNQLLASDGLPPQSVAAVRAMIGNGVRTLVERAYAASNRPITGAALDEATNRMMAIYGKHLTRHTTIMAGAADVLAALAGAGVKLGVVTNKPEAFTREVLTHFGFEDFIEVVVGGDTGPTRKPAPDMIEHALGVLGVVAGDVVMVGDSPADIDAARAASVTSIAVRGGYTNVAVEQLGATVVIDSLIDLAGAIEALRQSA
ncbi:phosphoglycolate phosphatase [Hoeflea sp. G2-23]|uniref:Phosphoglycolate phosphatase n=1 Tax=Hoeflea algicola TaxID=2983763 RepID=A0ABT3Z6W3_9HYPH|nr:phosphoglycolate phosphatase [Hoeflea algicola]MCY0147451.1 phosphoglycolate phosphatase [Hoeflea algicola]